MDYLRFNYYIKSKHKRLKRGVPLNRRMHELKLTRKRIIVAITLLIIVALGCAWFLISKMPSGKNNSAEGVLGISDLANPDMKLNSETSNASVDNLTKELKAKIDEQIAAKQNPIEAVNQLADVLASTTNTTRQDQLTSFVVDFLAKHEDALWFSIDSEAPDQAQVNYWKGSLYARLAYNYQFMMQNQFTGTDGKPINTTNEQLKYINLYLALAQDPASHSRSTEDYKDAPLAYTYTDANSFIKLRNELIEK